MNRGNHPVENEQSVLARLEKKLDQLGTSWEQAGYPSMWI